MPNGYQKLNETFSRYTELNICASSAKTGVFHLTYRDIIFSCHNKDNKVKA